MNLLLRLFMEGEYLQGRRSAEQDVRTETSLEGEKGQVHRPVQFQKGLSYRKTTSLLGNRSPAGKLSSSQPPTLLLTDERHHDLLLVFCSVSSSQGKKISQCQGNASSPAHTCNWQSGQVHPKRGKSVEDHKKSRKHRSEDQICCH